MDSKKIVEEKIKQMSEFAKNQDGMIRYNRVVDILCDKDDSITEETIQYVLNRLKAINIIVVQDQDEDYVNGSADADDFVPAEVRISQIPMNVYNLMERLENDEIDLSPEFQRHSELWSLEQQSRVI
jgi:hypothetical protein